jgi:hypothetical protein
MLTKEFLTNDLLKAKSVFLKLAGWDSTGTESGIKISAKQHNASEPNKETFQDGTAEGGLSGHPRHRPTKRVKSQGPKVI